MNQQNETPKTTQSSLDGFLRTVAWLYEKRNGSFVAIETSRLDHTHVDPSESQDQSPHYIRGKPLVTLEGVQSLSRHWVSVSEVWCAMGGNPDLIGSKNDLFERLNFHSRNGLASKDGPETIWLSFGDVPLDSKLSDLNEADWKTSKVFEADIGYIRSDVAQLYLEENVRLRSLLKSAGIEDKGHQQ